MSYTLIIMRISYSAFDTFNRCPLKYRLSYIDRIKTPKKPELYFGNLIHKIVQFALKKDPILPKEQELLALLQNEWQRDIFSSKDEARQYFEFGKEMLKKFYASFQPGLRNIVAVEKRFQIPLSDKHILSGVIDRVDKLPFGAFEVIDYKTSKALPTQIEVDKDKQLAVYNLAVQNLWPEIKDVRLTLYFLKFSSQITTKRREDEVESIKEEIIHTADKIESASDFPPRVNNLCDWCDYQHLCPLKKQTSNRSPLIPGMRSNRLEKEKIDDLVEEYILAREKIAEIEPKIHTHFDAEKIKKYSHKHGILSRGKNKKLTVKKH